MGVTSNVDFREVRDYLYKEYQRHLHRLISSLQYVGETVVNQIRDSDISYWEDHTGNLRSSIGYIIAVDGKPIGMSGFEKVEGPEADQTEEDGSEKGRAYARRIVDLYPEGIALIVVAGMEYASYVERVESRTVLAKGEIEARKLVTEMIQELNRRYGR